MTDSACETRSPAAFVALVRAVCVTAVVAISSVSVADEPPEQPSDRAVFWADVAVGAAWQSDSDESTPALDMRFAIESRPWRWFGVRGGVAVTGASRDPSPVIDVSQTAIVGVLGGTFWPLESGWLQPYLGVSGVVGQTELVARSGLGDRDELGSTEALIGGFTASVGVDFVLTESADDGRRPRKVLLGLEASSARLWHDLSGLDTELGAIEGASSLTLWALSASFGLGF